MFKGKQRPSGGVASPSVQIRATGTTWLGCRTVNFYLYTIGKYVLFSM